MPTDEPGVATSDHADGTGHADARGTYLIRIFVQSFVKIHELRNTESKSPSAGRQPRRGRNGLDCSVLIRVSLTVPAKRPYPLRVRTDNAPTV